MRSLEVYEFREATEYWRTRLLHPDGTPKSWDIIEFSNGYGPKVPKFRTTHVATHIWTAYHAVYSNGEQVSFVGTEHIVVELGPVFWRSA